VTGETPVAIVTGSDSGIGKATAVAFAAAGYDVGITWHRDEEGARGTETEIHEHGRRAAVRHLDVTKLDEAVAVVNDLVAVLGGLDAFVNDAGTGASTPFLDQSFEEWRHVLAVDLDAPFVLGQHAARIMRDAGTSGAIVNVTSVHEHVPLPGSAAYCAAKGGLGLLTKVMALELAEHGIRVNAIAPGEIATPMTGMHDVDPETEHRERIPLHRPGAAAEIADAIVFLADPRSSYTTGSSFVVDGGLLLMAAVRDS
jgi:NAD(P)-dependent dehydrogenase (short-subunit alcohol dehydrogenase family)